MGKSLCTYDLEVIEKYSDAVYRMAYSLVKNKFDADDIHQEVFAIYIIKKPEFENAEHERAWFMRVTVNLCRNLWKSAWRRKNVSLENAIEENAIEENAEIAAEPEKNTVMEVVGKLPFKYRIVIHLFYYEEFSVKEIAGILKMMPSNVRTRLTRARAKLKELLENGQ